MSFAIRKPWIFMGSSHIFGAGKKPKSGPWQRPVQSLVKAEEPKEHDPWKAPLGHKRHQPGGFDSLAMEQM